MIPRIGTLFIDCLPVGEAVVMFSRVVAEALAGETEDYRLLGDNGYGRAPGYLLDRVRDVFGMVPEGADIVVTSAQPEHWACLAWLEGLAARVVRGLLVR